MRVDLRGAHVVVTGGGPAATATASALVAEGALVRVVATETGPTLADLAARGLVTVVEDLSFDGVAAVAARSDNPTDTDTATDTDARTEAAAREAGVAVIPRTGTAAQAPGGGHVTILGGGPGDPGLLTIAGRRALEAADVVVADRLAPLAVLDDLARTPIIIDAAKVPGGRSMSQDAINAALIDHARAGRRVVRLKGGDPFVFGRGMEEVQACAAAGVTVDVIPGVTSAISVPGLMGVPVTHRGLTQAFTVVSGHVTPGHPESTVDWAALARSGATLVLLMAVRTLPAIAQALLAGGLDPATPTATITDGASVQATLVRSTLAALSADAAGFHPPAVTVVGAVAGLDGDPR